jgi:hypoxanthine phosphoribosyltransferase
MSFSPPIDTRGNRLYSLEHFKVQDKYIDDLLGIVISGGMVEDRIRKMADDLSTHVREELGTDEDEAILAICVIAGAMHIFDQLTRKIDHKVEEDVMGARSYIGTESSGEVEIYAFKPSKVRGRRVLLVEDIVDTGHTLSKVQKIIWENEPKSLTTVCLVDKPSRRKPGLEVQVDCTGFVIDDNFIVGVGLDYNGQYRDLYHIAVLKPEVYGRKDL